MENTVYWVWLQQALGAGSSRVDHLLQHYETAENFYRYGRRQLTTIPSLNREIREKIETTPLSVAEHICEATEKLGGWIMTPEHPAFPARLKNIFSVPCALYGKGKLPEFDGQLFISMVGTRRCSRYGYDTAFRVARELSQSGVCVVSGMAVGIDTACHEGALEGESPTVAVLGCGLDIDYPASNRALRQRVERAGALLTEYPPNSPPIGSNFPVRNRLIAGLSDGVVIVEAKEHSGSLITAGHALEQGKDLFVVPANVDTESGRCAVKILRDGAIPIGSALDILEEYPVQIAADRMKQQNHNHTKQQERETVSHLTESQRALYRVLTDCGLDAGELAAQCALALPEVMTLLTELEMLGLAQSLPGGLYRRGED